MYTSTSALRRSALVPRARFISSTNENVRVHGSLGFLKD
jgi:hypothetical protein